MYIQSLKTHLLISFFLFVHLIGASAQINLDGSVQNKRVETDEVFFLTTEDNLTFNEISSTKNQSNFELSKKKNIAVSNPNLEYWIKIPFQINTHSHWLFQTFSVHADSLDIYIPSSTGYNKKSLGTVGNHTERQVQIPELIFELENLEGTQVIYLRIKSKVPVTVESLFRTEGYFIHYSSRENIFRGLFYGLISSIGLLSLFLYLFSREKIYLLYAFYIFSTVLYNLVQSSVGHFFLWSNAYELNYFLLRYASFPLLITCSILYSTHYLKISANLKKQQAKTLYFLFFVIALEFTKQFPPYVPLALGTIICYGQLVYFIKQSDRYKQRFDRYFIVGFILMVLAVFLVFLRLFRLIESNIYTYYAFHIGLMLEATLFTISLAGRYHKVSKERTVALQDELLAVQKNDALQAKLIHQLEENELLQNKVQRELEQKVAQRTTELNDKNEELETFNKNLEELVGNLQEMNIHLDKSNWELKRESKTNTKDRFLNKQLTWEKFQETFPTDLACKHYLSEMKWADGFACSKCQSDKYYEGKQKLSRKCSSCAYEESPTARTIFSGIKFDLNKAFFIVHSTRNKTKITSKELALALDLKEETCRRFHKKVKEHLFSDSSKTKEGKAIFII